MIPRKGGRGIMGVRDLGWWLMGLGRSMRGGGMRCLETSISNDSSSWLSSGEGEWSLLRRGLSSMLNKLDNAISD